MRTYIAALYNQSRQHEKARALLESREFQPWEGGEGQVLNEYVRTCLVLGRQALASHDAAKAERCFLAASAPPASLGEARHLLANRAEIDYWLGIAAQAIGNRSAARESWKKAAGARGDFQEMSVRSFSELTYYSVLALKALQRTVDARRLARGLLQYAGELRKEKAAVDYFATSLPAMLLFDDDLRKRQTVTSLFLEAQARLLLGQARDARKVLKRVLKLDGSHARAADLLAEMGGKYARER